MTAFLTGFGTGFFGGMVKQQEEKRAEAAERRSRMMDHYLNVAIPKYQSTKAQAGKLRDMVEAYTNSGYPEQAAIEAVQASGGDYMKGLEYLTTYRDQSDTPSMAQQMEGLSVQTAQTVQPGLQETSVGTTPQASQAASGGTIAGQAQAAPPGVSQQPPGAPPSVGNFWNQVVLGDTPVHAVDDSIAQEIAAMYGTSPENVQGWIANAWQTPEQMAGIKPTGGIGPIDVGRQDRAAMAAKYSDPTLMENVPKESRQEYMSLVNAYKSGDDNALSEAASLLLDFEDMEQIKAAADPDAGEKVNPRENTAYRAIANEFGDVVDLPSGGFRFKAFNEEARQMQRDANAIAIRLINERNLSGGTAAELAIQMVRAGQTDLADMLGNSVPDDVPTLTEEQAAKAEPGTRFHPAGSPPGTVVTK